MRNPLIVASVCVGQKMEVGMVIVDQHGLRIAYRVEKEPWIDIMTADDKTTKSNLITLGRISLDSPAVTDKEALHEAGVVLGKLIGFIQISLISDVEELKGKAAKLERRYGPKSSKPLPVDQHA